MINIDDPATRAHFERLQAELRELIAHLQRPRPLRRMIRWD